jgi:hypothetical protein
VVGAKGFEPSTSWSRTRRASQAALRPEYYASQLIVYPGFPGSATTRVNRLAAQKEKPPESVRSSGGFFVKVVRRAKTRNAMRIALRAGW